jgi:uncharacterized membrane protein
LKSFENDAHAVAPPSQRIPSIDLLRGIVMVLMALDHTRDFFSSAFFNPLDLARTTPAFFFTRWITHFCAPIFVLLAGAGAYLYGARGHSNLEIARFLFIRGLLLIVFEFTLVHFGWFFNFDYHYLLAQVIWVIGWSMVILAVLIALRVPVWALTLMGVILMVGHNLLDSIGAHQFGSLQWLWVILHQPGTIEFGQGRQIFVLYSLVPWVGVMAVGYGLGPILLKSPDEWRKWLLGLGLGLTLAFIILRWGNVYGDPQRWIPYPDTMLQFLSFINTTKYPPSLLFLLMTLGPALITLSLLDRVHASDPLAHIFSTFGRVPLFYYVLHLSLIHAIAVVMSYIRYGEAPWLFGTDWMFRGGLPPDYGYELGIVYLVWIAVVIILYPICYWFARYKERGRAAWLSYL